MTTADLLLAALGHGPAAVHELAERAQRSPLVVEALLRGLRDEGRVTCGPNSRHITVWRVVSR